MSKRVTVNRRLNTLVYETMPLVRGACDLFDGQVRNEDLVAREEDVGMFPALAQVRILGVVP